MSEFEVPFQNFKNHFRTFLILAKSFKSDVLFFYININHKFINYELIKEMDKGHKVSIYYASKI